MLAVRADDFEVFADLSWVYHGSFLTIVTDGKTA